MIQICKTTVNAAANLIWNMGVPQTAFLAGIALNEASKRVTGKSFVDVVETLPKNGFKTIETVINVSKSCLNSMKNINFLKETVIKNKELFGFVAVMTAITLGTATLVKKITQRQPPTICNKVVSIAVPILVGFAVLVESPRQISYATNYYLSKQIEASVPATIAVVATVAIASQLPFVSLKVTSGVAATLGYVANKVSALTNGAAGYLPSCKWPRL